jgi:hypothetical protein
MAEQSHAGAWIVQRTSARLAGLQRELSLLRNNFVDREDLPGVRLLLRVLTLISEALERESVHLGRNLPTPFPAPANVAGPTDVLIAPELQPVTTTLHELEEEIEEWKSVLDRPQGSTFDAISEPYIGLAKRLPLDQDVELIFQPVPVLSYQLFPSVLQKFRTFAAEPDLRDLIDDLPRLMAIEYPLAFEADTFLHGAIAHEVAHISLLLGEWTGRIWDPVAKRHGVTEKGEEARQRKLWEELSCDLLGVNLLGPASALGFFEFSLTRNVWLRPTNTKYPSLSWRLAVLAQALKPYLSGTTRGAKRSKAVVKRTLGLLKAAAGSEPAVIEAVNEVQEKAEEILGDAWYDPAIFKKEVVIAWDKLARRIAPAEVVFGRDRQPTKEEEGRWSAPLDWRAILNGGYIDWLDGNPVHQPYQHRGQLEQAWKARREVCELIRGSIELSYLHERMWQQRDRLSQLEMAA